MHKATLLTIGDELLIGQTIDTNSAWMGEQLNALGIKIEEKITLADTEEAIINCLERAMNRGDIILITGGLGPTIDDITKQVLADYFGMEMVFDQATYDRIARLHARYGKPESDIKKNQCVMPDGAVILDNKMGTAPGMLFEKDGKCIISMPGVPHEMKYIMEHSVLPMLKDKYSDQAIIHHTILTAGEWESIIEVKIDVVLKSMPDYIQVAYLPGLGMVKIRLTATGTDEEILKKEIYTFGARIENILGDIVFGHDKETLASTIGRLALQKKLTIGTAESCTGGLIANKIVEISGSSQYFIGSVITYSYGLKIKILGVDPNTLDIQGAVSEETVIEMVNGGIALLGVDIVVAVSGIAGPTGETERKPVGTAWIACGNKDKIVTLLVRGGKNRVKNIEFVSNFALNVLRKYIQDQ